MRLVSASLVALLGAGCALRSSQEDPDDWYAPAEPYDVQEPVAFTDQPYGFTGDTPIADLPLPEDFQTIFAPDDLPDDLGCPDWVENADLPAEISGIVTVLPRFYYKTSGCAATQEVDADEKYYGSYFIEDDSGGFFVLGDSKVAHFDMGDRVTLRVRAIKESFDQVMIASHDVVGVERGPEPIHYEAVDGEPLGPEHVSRVVRVEGTVALPMSSFGEVYLDSDPGSPDSLRYKFSLDAELSRRGLDFGVGDRVRVTGPVLYSFSEYTVIVMRVGQTEVLERAAPAGD